jgi:conjugative transfer signal peptidase TraF
LGRAPMKGLCAFALLVLVVAVSLSGLRYNLTPSMPRGIYFAVDGWHRGDVVALCAPNAIIDEGVARGYIPHGPGGRCYRSSVPLVKVLAGVPGDRVDVSPAGVSINGALWPNSQRRYVTRSGERITQWMTGHFRLPADRVLVLGVHPESWDSRVWGPVPTSSVRARWIPILTTASLGGL